MKTRVKLLYFLVLVSLIALPLFSGCAPTEEAAPTPTREEKPNEVILRAMLDITGPYGAVMAQVPMALTDSIAYMNEQGGIDGVPLTLELFDTTNDREVAMSQYMKWREEKPAFIFVGQLADAEMLLERAAEDKILLFSCLSSDRALWPPTYYLATGTDAADEAGYVIDQISEEWRKSGESRKCRLAILNPDYPLGHAYASPAVIDYIEATDNIELVDTEFCDFRATDVSTELTRIMSHDPDWIYTVNLYGLFTATLKGADALGMLDKTRFATASWNMDPIQIRLCGADLVDGVIGPAPIPAWSGDDPGTEIMSQQITKNNRGEENKTFFYSYAFLASALMAGVVDETVSEYGWDGLTGPNMLSTIESIDRLNPWGLLEMVFNGKKHSVRQMRMLQFKDGEVVSIGDWGVATDLRPEEARKAEWGWKK